MKRFFAGLVLVLAACGTPVLPVELTPQTTFIPNETSVAPLKSVTASAPVSAPTNLAESTPTLAADSAIVSIFSNVSHSTDTMHLECDPLEIIFDVTISDPNVDSVDFFFRMKDKATGLVNDWSNGEKMKTPGNGNFEFILQAAAIPNEARYKEAWLQYQFVAVNRLGQNISHSQIFADQIIFTPACP
jgi:hypothetical protein